MRIFGLKGALDYTSINSAGLKSKLSDAVRAVICYVRSGDTYCKGVPFEHLHLEPF
jgi:hypothetical protein